MLEKPAAGVGRGNGNSHGCGRVLAANGVMGFAGCRDCQAAAAELNGHKKTVSESETVAGQQSEKIAKMPKAKSEKSMMAKTFRSTRGSLLSRVPRFVNKFFG